MTPDEVVEMRALIRSLIAEAVPAVLQPQEIRPVSIGNDAELGVLVRTLIEMLDDPVHGARLRTGQIGFTLHPAAPSAPAARSHETQQPPQQPPMSVLEIESGAVTEKVVERAAAERLRLVLGPRAVLTPLARELIRRAGVPMERRTC